MSAGAAGMIAARSASNGGSPPTRWSSLCSDSDWSISIPPVRPPVGGSLVLFRRDLRRNGLGVPSWTRIGGRTSHRFGEAPIDALETWLRDVPVLSDPRTGGAIQHASPM